MTAVRVHRVNEVDHERRLTLRTLATARYYTEQGDRENAAALLAGASCARRILTRVKAEHAACCPGETRAHTIQLPSWRQLTWAPRPLRPGRWLP